MDFYYDKNEQQFYPDEERDLDYKVYVTTTHTVPARSAEDAIETVKYDPEFYKDYGSESYEAEIL
ncbi:hypothetical protein [Aerococcus sp. 1KP-2016]|uniref:hypothetical protein n=1 Tax=Aerococcus sp. 1KP-2016 TaxID=1981982 RepID=UPI000B9989B5|nr:hypothetical protein [Aerococcus sp. 1KP-2016]OYQ68297.1 hypothetical protein B9P78_00370 [Aerococcus sp. 1KP-2016]